MGSSPCPAEDRELLEVNNAGKQHIPIQLFPEGGNLAMQAAPLS
jgi:hypothetical protein